MRKIDISAVGLGLRSEHINNFLNTSQRWDIDFLELAPDNWMNVGGVKKEYLEEISKRYPLIAHSLSLSIGDILPLNISYIKDVRRFLEDYQISIYSDHLCFSRDQQGYLYDLLPIPYFSNVLPYISDRVIQVQDILGRQLVLENISSYHRYGGEMPEHEFWGELLHRTGCGMLLDINNVYVNAFNHKFDPVQYIKSLNSSSIVYYHIAGHLETRQFRLDTHGMPVIQDVLELAKKTIEVHGVRPVILERDNNIPPLDELCSELMKIKKYIS